MRGLIISVATAWQSAASTPSNTPDIRVPRVSSQAWRSSVRRPRAIATITPETSKVLPTSVQPHSVSPRKNQASTAEKSACVANSTPERRGPSRFMQANRAVSPMKMPIRPETTRRPTAGPSRLRHWPVKAASAHKSVSAKKRRQRVKANAPMLLDALAEKRLPTAQQRAASAARISGRTTGQLPAIFMRLIRIEPTVLAP